jgi:hypothetical protein
MLTGWLDGFDGKQKFDSSVDRGDPLTFTVGKSQVIAGWDEALLTGMTIGTVREVVIPPPRSPEELGMSSLLTPHSSSGWNLSASPLVFKLLTLQLLPSGQGLQLSRTRRSSR